VDRHQVVRFPSRFWETPGQELVERPGFLVSSIAPLALRTNIACILKKSRRPGTSHRNPLMEPAALVCSTVPNSPVGVPKLPKPWTRSPGVYSRPVAEGSESGGLLARSESAIAPACDSGGLGALLSLGIDLVVREVIFHFDCFFPRGHSSALHCDVHFPDYRYSTGS
jgi:hypothetical protein